MTQPKPRVYIFDLDDTLYQKNDKGFVCNIINPDMLRNLIGIKILFSNGTFTYCNTYLMRMGLKDCFTAIFSYDILGHYKPHLSTYETIMSVCDFNPDLFDVIFFDNMHLNLIPAYECYKWKTILILPYSPIKKIQHQPLINVSMSFNNINDAVDFFIKN